MTTLSIWIAASVDTLTNCAGCMEEVKDRPEYLLKDPAKLHGWGISIENCEKNYW